MPESGVLEADGIPTPVDEAPAGLSCETCGAERNPKSGKPWTRQTLGTHRWLVHKIKAGGSSSATSSASGKSRAKKPPSTGTPAKPLAQRLEGSIGLVGIGVSFLEPYDGRCIQQGAKNFAEALDALCAQYPEARKYVEMLCLDSPALAVVIAALPILLPILAHHGIIRIPLPPAFAGPPDRRARTGGPTGDPPSPAGSPLGDVLASAMQDPGFMTAAMQAMAGAARPMGNGDAPEPAKAPPAVTSDEAVAIE